MGQILATWATANPLPAIALSGVLLAGLTALVLAVGKAARPVAVAIRAWQAKRTNGHAKHGEHTGELLDEFTGLGLPPGEQTARRRGGPFVLPAGPRNGYSDVEVAVLREAVAEMREFCFLGKDSLQSRLLRVEEAIEAQRQETRDALAAQTVELKQAFTTHTLAAFRAAVDEANQNTKQAIAAFQNGGGRS